MHWKGKVAVEEGPIKATESPSLVDFMTFVGKAPADPVSRGQ